MKIQLEVKVPHFTTDALIWNEDTGTNIDQEEVFVIVPETKQEVEFDLDELDLDRLKEFVQDETDCTLVNNDRLRFIDEFEEDFSELIECFNKHCLNYIQKQELIQSIVNQLDGN